MSDTPRRTVPRCESLYVSEFKSLARGCDGNDKAYCEKIVTLLNPGQLVWVDASVVERLRNPTAPVTKVEPPVEPPADVNVSVVQEPEEPPADGDDF